MSLKDTIVSIFITEGHDEPVSQLEILDGVGVEAKDGDR